MTNFLKIALVSLALFASATAVQAGNSSGVEDFDIEDFWVEQSLNGGA